MDAIELLGDALSRVRDDLPGLVEGLTAEELLWRPGPEANPIAWLVWHIARVEESEVDTLTDLPQTWDQEWQSRFGLPYEPQAMGYGQSSAQVAQFNVTDPQLLLGYFRAADLRAQNVLSSLDAAALDRIVDTNWDPPVTAGARLVSMVNDVTQHLGAVAYVHGLLGSRATH